MKTRLAWILVLASFGIQSANADCIARMVQDSERLAKLERSGNIISNTGQGIAMGGVLVAAFIPPLGLGIIGGALVTSGVVGAYSRFNLRPMRNLLLTNTLLYLRTSSASDADETAKIIYENLRDEVQYRYPEITEDQIRGAIAVGNNDESLCPKGKAMSRKKTSDAIAKIVGELSVVSERK